MTTRLSLVITKHLRSPQRDFTLDIGIDSDTEITVLFGPSGAGKTLTLQAVAGLVRPDRGTIRCGSRTLFDSVGRIDVPARRRGVGYVLQD